MVRQALLIVVIGAAAVAFLAGCGGSSDHAQKACGEDRSALAQLAPVRRLADAETALRAVVAVERDALTAVGGGDKLAPRLRAAIVSAERALAAVEADPLRTRTMSPLRTGVPAARRALATARQLVAELCR